MKTEVILDEIWDALNQISKIFNRTQLTKNQQGILINRQISQIRSSINQLVVIKIQNKGYIWEKILRKFTDFYLFEQDHLKGTLFYYQIQVFRLKILTDLLQAWGAAGKMRLLGTANVLANMLIKIDNVDVETLSVSNDHPEYDIRFALLFNYLNFFPGMYYTAASNLYIISQQEFINWVSLALQGNEKILQCIMDKIDIFEMYNRLRKYHKTKTFYNQFSILMITFSHMIHYILLINRRMHGHWFKQISKVSFLKVDSPKFFLSSLDHLNNRYQQIIEDYRRLNSEKIFDFNENPLQNPSILSIFKHARFTNLLVKGVIQAYMIVEKQSDYSQLYQIVNDFQKFFPNNFLGLKEESYLYTDEAENLADQLEFFVFFAGLIAVKENSIEFINQFLKSLGVFNSENSRHYYPALFSLIYTIRLTIGTNLNDEEVLNTNANKLIENSKLLVFFPRDEFSNFLLGHMILLALNQESIEEFNQVISHKFRETAPYLQKSLREKIQLYLTFIEKQPDEWKKYINKNNLFTPLSGFDAYTVLIPQINKISYRNSSLKEGHYEFVPFNLGIYGFDK